MSRKQKKSGNLFMVVVPVIAALLCLAGVLTYRHYSITDEDKLTAIVNQLAVDAQNKAAANILSRIADDYTDNVYANRAELAEHLRYWAVSQISADIVITLNDIEVEVSPDGNHAAVTFTVTGNQPIQQILTHFHSDGKVSLHFRKDNGEWKLFHSEPIR